MVDFKTRRYMRIASILLSAACLIGACVPTAARAQGGRAGALANSPFPVTQGKSVRFEKIADGVYYATGGTGSNDTVIVNDNDVVLVDDGTTPGSARALVEDIRLLTPKPIKFVVNTHFHYDHTDGNQIFGPDVLIIGHDYIRHAISTLDILHREPFNTSQLINVPARIKTLNTQIGAETDATKKAALQKQLASTEKTWDELKEIKPTPPNLTFDSKMTLVRGSREIQILFLGRGHTDGDTLVYLPRERILCTGDLMESGPAYMGDGEFDEWIATLDRVKQIDFAWDLPGHGFPFAEKTRITAWQSYLGDLITQATALRKQGVPVEEAAKRMDMTSHAKDFPSIRGPGVQPREMNHIYDWLAAKEKH
jgi:cyclase